MTESHGSVLVADIGNSTIDFGVFDPDQTGSVAVPEPLHTTKFAVTELAEPPLKTWLARQSIAKCIVGSVNEPAREQLERLLSEIIEPHVIHTVRHTDFDLATAVREPEAVGIDRLAGVVAAKRLRAPSRPAIVVSSGSAITINVLSADGTFLGGMISPGMHLSAHTLASKTDQLPMVRTESSAPTMIGADTVSAIKAGVFWTTVAGLDGVLARLQQELAGPCDIFGTGGSFPELLEHLQHDMQFKPHLVLSGLAMAKS